MNSSTSNSKTGLIGKAAAACLAVLILFLFSAPYLYQEGWSAPQSQWQFNVIKAQRYVYQDKAAPFVIIGSSLSQRLSSLSGDYYNLALGGGSPITGMKVLLRGGKFPSTVLVEINMIIKPSDENFLDGLFMPVLYDLRRYVPGLREEYQPLALLSGKILNIWQTGRLTNAPARPQPAANATKAAAEAEAALKRITASRHAGEAAFKIALADHQKKQSALWDDRLKKNKNILYLKEAVDALSQHGVRVIFYEMPTDPSLIGLPKTVSIRERMHQEFPDASYWLPQVDANEYATTDGMHLDGESARKYAAFLQSEMKARFPDVK
ncbi:MAG: hypothetical protein HY894_10290 [Deltaproteobacteria bacterium]|nr:hypothetical protein [Deltaproteobacteria bacterium]